MRAQKFAAYDTQNTIPFSGWIFVYSIVGSRTSGVVSFVRAGAEK